jgi:hypothetical protein
MEFRFQALFFAVLVCFSNCEVDNEFGKCKQFFYKESPPSFSALDLKDICQYYQNSYHFASTYSTDFRIPVYSAYLLPRGRCHGQQPERLKTWFVEPQVCPNFYLDVRSNYDYIYET